MQEEVDMPERPVCEVEEGPTPYLKLNGNCTLYLILCFITAKNIAQGVIVSSWDHQAASQIQRHPLMKLILMRYHLTTMMGSFEAIKLQPVRSQGGESETPPVDCSSRNSITVPPPPPTIDVHHKDSSGSEEGGGVSRCDGVVDRCEGTTLSHDGHHHHTHDASTTPREKRPREGVGGSGSSNKVGTMGSVGLCVSDGVLGSAPPQVNESFNHTVISKHSQAPPWKNCL
ncbi:hypothetical protein Pcinc_011922 [Petrolisthes cinctipes]|uniref:Uncharacterized protein n=1 Tax=Petrolisthes cinctipes TaxID=88211 RepID=A0AAE1FZY5_PETCI|nr:hypothetical protein Pcinc_011922 [Petrolisthes cinctipes]